MKKLSDDQWKNIFRNISEMEEESAYDDEWVTVIYLDPMTESDSKWGLAHDEELFEEGFESEEEAIERLQQLENEILGHVKTI